MDSAKWLARPCTKIVKTSGTHPDALQFAANARHWHWMLAVVYPESMLLMRPLKGYVGRDLEILRFIDLGCNDTVREATSKLLVALDVQPTTARASFILSRYRKTGVVFNGMDIGDIRVYPIV